MSDTIIPYTSTTAREVAFVSTNPPENSWLLKAHADDAAYDLRAAEDYYLVPGDSHIVKTGVRLAIPEGFAGLVLPRSGLASKHNITIPNSPGLIDPGYRGEIGVCLYRQPTFQEIAHIAAGIVPGSFEVCRGDRIAQLLIVRTADTRFDYWLANAFDDISTERGEGGFGSTGR